jgi:hypothetical protein
MGVFGADTSLPALWEKSWQERIGNLLLVLVFGWMLRKLVGVFTSFQAQKLTIRRKKDDDIQEGEELEGSESEGEE